MRHLYAGAMAFFAMVVGAELGKAGDPALAASVLVLIVGAYAFGRASGAKSITSEPHSNEPTQEKL